MIATLERNIQQNNSCNQRVEVIIDKDTKLTSENKRSMIVWPYCSTTFLHAWLVTPDAPIAWLICVITLCIKYNGHWFGFLFANLMFNQVLHSLAITKFSQGILIGKSFQVNKAFKVSIEDMKCHIDSQWRSWAKIRHQHAPSGTTALNKLKFVE